MHLKKTNPKKAIFAPKMRSSERGQALVESALSLLLFLSILIGIVDFGQILFTHQFMVERVRAGARYGSVVPWDGSGDAIANVVLYHSATAPAGATKGFLGMTRANVSVSYIPGTAAEPNNEAIRVAIVNYRFQLFSPLIAKSFTKSLAAVETVPMYYKP